MHTLSLRTHQCISTLCISVLTVTQGHVLELERNNPGTMLKMFKGFQKRVLPALQEGVRLREEFLAAEEYQRELKRARAEGRDPPPQHIALDQRQSTGEHTAEAKGTEEEGEEAKARTKAGAAEHGLSVCARCHYPTTGKECAWCKMVDQLTEYKTKHPESFTGKCMCEQCLKMRGETRDIEDTVKSKKERAPRHRGACPRCKRPGHVLAECRVVRNKNTPQWDREHPDDIPAPARHAIAQAQAQAQTEVQLISEKEDGQNAGVPETTLTEH